MLHNYTHNNSVLIYILVICGDVHPLIDALQIRINNFFLNFFMYYNVYVYIAQLVIYNCGVVCVMNIVQPFVLNKSCL